MLFAVWARDAQGMQAVRERVRPRHRARLRQPAPHLVEVVLAGPLFDESGAHMNGTLLVVESEAIAAVHAFIAADPYVLEGVYERYEILPWRCGLGPLAPAHSH